MSIFQQYQEGKEKTLALFTQAKDWGWITEAEYADYLKRLEDDRLIIGVVGQMKAGKSTFLNAFVFKEDVLPSATTPMTAALSVITYGERKRLVAEFYNEEEWLEQQNNASRNLDEIQDEFVRSKVQAARELLESSKRLGGEAEIKRYLQKSTQEDDLTQLVEYVGAQGKYVSITKAVRIEYPHEYLRGVEIVDTPGFNDPIVSREERTKDFLKRADVVLMMLYAGRPFDATDREILFNHIGSCAVGRLVIGLNKYDILHEEGRDEQEIADYVRSEIDKVCQGEQKEDLVKMVKSAEVVPVSAQMALLSYLPLSEIQASDSYSHALRRYEDMFEDLSSHKDLLLKSKFSDLERQIQNIISKEKEAILSERPRKAILSIAERKEQEYRAEIAKFNGQIENLSLSDDGLEDKLRALERLQRRIRKSIQEFNSELEVATGELRLDYVQKLRSAIDSGRAKLHKLINQAGTLQWEKLKRDYELSFDKLIHVNLSELQGAMMRDLRGIIRKTIGELTQEIEKQIYDKMEDFSPKIVVNQIITYIQKFESEDRTFTPSQDESEADAGSNLKDFLSFVFSHITFPLSIPFMIANSKDTLRNHADQLKKIDSQGLVDKLIPSKGIFDKLEEILDKQLFAELIKDIEDLQQNKVNRETLLSEAQQAKQQAEAKLKELGEQRQSLGL